MEDLFKDRIKDTTEPGYIFETNKEIKWPAGKLSKKQDRVTEKKRNKRFRTFKSIYRKKINYLIKHMPYLANTNEHTVRYDIVQGRQKQQMELLNKLEQEMKEKGYEVALFPPDEENGVIVLNFRWRRDIGR